MVGINGRCKAAVIAKSKILCGLSLWNVTGQYFEGCTFPLMLNGDAYKQYFRPAILHVSELQCLIVNDSACYEL